MKNVDEFVEEFLSHKYDPVKAREYYLRTRKLKGRQPGKKVVKPVDPRSNVSFNGGPLPKNKRMNEDETPVASPSGAKLVDYDGKGLGKATFADGSVYDPKSGWTKGGQSAVNSARAQNNANRAKTGRPQVSNRRIGAAEQKLIRAKTLAKRVKDPSDRAELLKRLKATERKLTSVKNRTNPGLTDTSKKGSSIRPVLRKQPQRGV